jgi:hypothetical protein
VHCRLQSGADAVLATTGATEEFRFGTTLHPQSLRIEARVDFPPSLFCAPESAARMNSRCQNLHNSAKSCFEKISTLSGSAF